MKSVGRRAYDWRGMESGDVVGEVGILKCDVIIKHKEWDYDDRDFYLLNL